jgi:hypothetical protein
MFHIWGRLPRWPLVRNRSAAVLGGVGDGTRLTRFGPGPSLRCAIAPSESTSRQIELGAFAQSLRRPGVPGAAVQDFPAPTTYLFAERHRRYGNAPMAIDFRLTSDQRALQLESRAFAADVLATARTAELLPTPEERFGATKPVYEAMVTAGFLRKCIPASAGGENAGLIDVAIMAEEFYSVNASVTLTMLGTLRSCLEARRSRLADCSSHS